VREKGKRKTHKKRKDGTERSAEKGVASENGCRALRVGDAQVIEDGKEEGDDSHSEQGRPDHRHDPRDTVSCRPAVPE
jgi:hypothetical protein